jgi:hypothetical protein
MPQPLRGQARPPLAFNPGRAPRPPVYIEQNCILTKVLVYGIIPLRITNPSCLARRGGHHTRRWPPSSLFGCGIPPLAPPSGRRFMLRGRVDGQDFGRCCPVCRAHARLLSTNRAFEHEGGHWPAHLDRYANTWTDTPTLGQLRQTLGRLRPALGQLRPALGQLRQHLDSYGQHLDSYGQHLDSYANTWTIAAPARRPLLTRRVSMGGAGGLFERRTGY